MPATAATTVFNTSNTGGNAQINNVVYQVTPDHEKEIYQWLAAPDSSGNLHAAQEEHHDDTGTWFIEGWPFAKWKMTSDSAMWVYGSPGCGKTIICSTVIDEILRRRADNPTHACAYFFFDNRSGQSDLSSHNKFIRSIIRQLSYQSSGMPASLMEVYGGGHQQPSITSLQLTLQRIIEGFQRVYIVIDALDECTDRKKVLAWIEELMQWRGGKVRILVSSRPETDIKEKFNAMAIVVQFSLAGNAMNKDIERYIDAMLLGMVRWDDKTRAHVRDVLIRGAQGMFRWVALQILALSKCRTRRAVDAQLQTLPRDLDTTYEKMLLSSANPHDLKLFLMWLAFSQNNLKAEELADVITVDFSSKGGPSYDEGLRCFGTADMLDMCSGFIVEIKDDDGTFVTLAHMSVKDYLVSEYIKGGAASYFSIDKMLAHSVIAQICLAYLLHLGTFLSVDQTTVQFYPLARYAAKSWVAHMRLGNVDDEHVSHMTARLFSPEGNALVNWVRIYNPDNPYNHNYTKAPADIAPPLYYASFHGLEETVKQLLTSGADIHASGGEHGSALLAASYHGHERVIASLLDRGADANAQGGPYGYPLQAASLVGKVEVVRLLLDSNADVNAQGGLYANALQAASWHGGSVEVVQLLLDSGADVNTQGGHYGNSLQAASHNGSVEVVQLLLDSGADINAQGGEYGNALQAASHNGNAEVVQLLLDSGANVNAQGGEYGNALQAASWNGKIEVVRLLLDSGANVNAQGEYYGNALQAASWHGNAKISQLLLDRGTDVNAQGGFYGNALQAASRNGKVEVVQLLLDSGAEVNAQGGEYGNALQVASYNGAGSVVSLLLENGADVNTIRRPYNTALEAGCAGCHTSIVQLLVQKGADMREQGARALRIARMAEIYYIHGLGGYQISQESRDGTVRILLENGAVADEEGSSSGEEDDEMGLIYGLRA